MARVGPQRVDAGQGVVVPVHGPGVGVMARPLFAVARISVHDDLDPAGSIGLEPERGPLLVDVAKQRSEQQPSIRPDVVR